MQIENCVGRDEVNLPNCLRCSNSIPQFHVGVHHRISKKFVELFFAFSIFNISEKSYAIFFTHIDARVTWVGSSSRAMLSGFLVLVQLNVKNCWRPHGSRRIQITGK